MTLQFTDRLVVTLAHLRLVPTGVTTITEVTVTDTFGTTTPVSAVAEVDQGRGPWRLWDLVDAGPDAGPGPALRLLPPPSPPPLQGPVLEEILVARDELANLAWLIELQTLDSDGAVVDRFRRHLERSPAGDPAFRPTRSGSNERLGAPIADYWYPLVAGIAADGRPVLRLAAVPPGAHGAGDDGVAGRIVPHRPGTEIADEEVPREESRLVRCDRLTVGPDGFVVWRARVNTAGRGAASSGLRCSQSGVLMPLLGLASPLHSGLPSTHAHRFPADVLGTCVRFRPRTRAGNSAPAIG
ncbi:hypothetical protein DLJ47_28900 [Micromonospora sp. S4605]|uniref:hypothetical protein n=1 Tax=Micromonospora sp. S4605 TaxID=1420897 RepID=UPI000D6F2F3A|nr:hypothetical protein [Micromonospora sp. S4605]PWU48116.1 hypothetical protein DLJ47_28900 [Micromonospora sp. S4605]